MIQPPLLHKKTKQALKNYLTRPAHALLLTGDDGTGKFYIAQWLAQQMKYQPINVAVLPDKQMIGIDQIQALYTQTRSGINSCVIIRDAQQLTTDAQNALLKLLEEPPKNTHFVLTSSSEDGVLQTIKSRCQIINLSKPALDAATEHLATAFPNTDTQLVATVIRTTSGKLGTATTVLTSEESLSEHQALVDDAKTFYSSEHYQRLALLGQHGFDRAWSLQLLTILSVIVESLVTGSASDPRRIAKLSQQTTLIDATNKALAQAGNPKIHMTKLALNL